MPETSSTGLEQAAEGLGADDVEISALQARIVELEPLSGRVAELEGLLEQARSEGEAVAAQVGEAVTASL